LPVRDGAVDMRTVPRPQAGDVAVEPRERDERLASVSIVVPTIDRPEALTRSVKALLDTGYPDLEVLVVDNRPDPERALRWREFAESDRRVSYLTEHRRGISHARNAGIAAAHGEYVGFVDDDIEVDPWWLHNLAAELADERADCATSLVLPTRLESLAQRTFEQMKGFGQGLERRVFGPELAAADPGYALSPGKFGPGGCALWRRSTLVSLGGFDPLLGTGSPSRAGEDLFLFLRLARRGGTVVYAPDAVAWHDHGVEWPELRDRIRGYGTGLCAMLLLHVLRRPADLGRLARALPGRVRHVLLPATAPGARQPELAAIPRSLLFTQLHGIAGGPLALARSARLQRRLRAHAARHLARR
ncbi:MAG: glycosyltransferase, partial [Sciscionella sp.]